MQDVAEALETDPSILSAVIGKAVSAAKASEAAKKARELVRRKSALTRTTLPGKLADCASTDKTTSEIFLVEGDSAGASIVSLKPIVGCAPNAAPNLPCSPQLACGHARPQTGCVATGSRTVWQFNSVSQLTSTPA